MDTMNQPWTYEDTVKIDVAKVNGAVYLILENESSRQNIKLSDEQITHLCDTFDRLKK